MNPQLKMILYGIVAGILSALVWAGFTYVTGFELGWIAWGVGISGGRVLLERHGRWVHITPARLDMADRWFERRGERIVFTARCLPIIRTGTGR